MVKYADAALDTVFAALADATRRQVLASLSDESHSVSELAMSHAMSLPGFMKHLRVLEDAGLVARSKTGRVVRCTLSPGPMQEASMWLSRYEKFWTVRLDALARYLYHDKEITSSYPIKPGNDPSSSSIAATPHRPKKSGARGRTRKR